MIKINSMKEIIVIVVVTVVVNLVAIVADWIIPQKGNVSVEDLASNLRILHIVVYTILGMVVRY
jgi:hypothetical protein